MFVSGDVDAAVVAAAGGGGGGECSPTRGIRFCADISLATQLLAAEERCPTINTIETFTRVRGTGEHTPYIGVIEAGTEFQVP